MTETLRERMQRYVREDFRTQGVIAEDAGIPQEKLSKWMNGKANLFDTEVDRLLKALRCSVTPPSGPRRTGDLPDSYV